MSAALPAAAVAAGQRRLGELRACESTAHWIEQRPDRDGERTIWCASLDRAPHALPPPVLSVRSRVHEYGGGSYLACSVGVFAVDESSQQIWWRREDRWTPLTDAPDWRFAALSWHSAGNALIGVGECHGGSQVINALVRVSLDDGSVQPLFEGADFVGAPALGGDRIAWVSWDHPNMPWQNTRLWSAMLGPGGLSTPPRLLAGGDGGEAIQQPRWFEDGRLGMISDRGSGWWNLWVCDPATGECRCDSPLDAELGRAPWELALQTWDTRDGRIAAVACRAGVDRLLLGALDRPGWHEAVLPEGVSRVSGLAASDSGWWLLVGGPARAQQVVHLADGGSAVCAVSEAAPLPLPADRISVPATIECPSDGRAVQAFFYPPVETPADPPPLVVVMHGGPTSAADSTFNPLFQFWTSRGYAVVDVNYRGSTGFGRDYRLALGDEWGRGDVRDCIAVVNALIERGAIDPRRVAIRGGSAGGLTALAAAAHSDRFAAVGCHYGVCDLAALAAHTHKFESRYLDHLIGPLPEQAARYRERSPLQHLGAIEAIVYVSHGALDRVVPFEQAEALVAALRAQGGVIEVDVFADERHGYARADNVSRQLERELAVFERAFSR